MKRVLYLTLFLFCSSCVKEQVETVFHSSNYNSIQNEKYLPKGETTIINLSDDMSLCMDSDSVYFIGDVLFTHDQVNNLLFRTKGAFLSDYINYWPYESIPYFIPSGFSSIDYAYIMSGLTMIMNSSCLKFHRVTYPPSNGIFFKPSDGNNSYIGKKSGGNIINLIRNGFSPGTCAHEIMHALGFFHEHDRADRDNYITVHTQNIDTAYLHAFVKYTLKGYNGEDYSTYDYESILHYGSYYFSKDDISPTITKKNGDIIVSQRTHLTQNDKKTLNFIYGPIPGVTPIVYNETANNGPDWIDETTVYKNRVTFTDKDGQSVSLSYPRKIIAKHLTRSYDPVSDNYTTTSIVQTFVAPAGASVFYLNDTYREREVDMGIVRTDTYEWYEIIR